MFEELVSISGLSLDRLNNFLAFADEKSIIRAARNNPVRQSLISRQIGELEQFFGVELAKRHGRGKVLTDAGERLAVVVRDHFAALKDLLRDAKQMPATLKIAAPNSIAVWILLPRLAAIRSKLPRHQLTVVHEQSGEIIRGVQEGRHDIGFVRDNAMPRTLGRKAIGQAGFSLFVSPSLASRLDKKDRHGWLRLPLAMPIGGRLREGLEKLAMKHEVTLDRALVCNSFIQAAAAVESGAVAAVLPAMAAGRLKSKDLRVIPLPELKERQHLMIWSKRAEKNRPSIAEAVKVLGALLTA